MSKICEFMNCLNPKLLKNSNAWRLKNRECALIQAGGAGLALALTIYCGTSLFGLGNSTLQSSITILALGLPTFVTL